MTPRTYWMVGVAIVLLGLGVVSMGWLQQDDNVRQVGHVVAEPERYQDGTWVLVGLPQTPQVPVMGERGQILINNSAYQNETVHIAAWSLQGRPVQSRIVLGVEQDATGSYWSFTNTTTAPGNPTILDEQSANWSLRAGPLVFQVEGFEVGGASHTRIWAIYDGVMREPLQPKPSQFKGRLMSEMAGVALPPGALVYGVEQVTVGCSSKFLPAEYQP
jgi:hypothetical protein